LTSSWNHSTLPPSTTKVEAAHPKPKTGPDIIPVADLGAMHPTMIVMEGIGGSFCSFFMWLGRSKENKKIEKVRKRGKPLNQKNS
jgi:hypothetical protein